MPVRSIIETKPSPYAGKSEETVNYLMGLAIDDFVFSTTIYGSDLVARREGCPHGVYIQRDPQVTAFVIPVGKLNFSWGSGHNNHNILYDGMPGYRQNRLPQLSPATNDTLVDMIRLGHPAIRMVDSTVPNELEERYAAEEGRIHQALDEVFGAVEKYVETQRVPIPVEIQEQPTTGRRGIKSVVLNLYRRLF